MSVRTTEAEIVGTLNDLLGEVASFYEIGDTPEEEFTREQKRALKLFNAIVDFTEDIDPE